MKRLLYAALVALFLAGCGSPADLREDTEKSLLKAVNAKMVEKNITARATSVSLVEDSPFGKFPQRYKGFVRFDSGVQTNISVTRGEDNQILWEGD